MCGIFHKQSIRATNEYFADTTLTTMLAYCIYVHRYFVKNTYDRFMHLDHVYTVGMKLQNNILHTCHYKLYEQWKVSKCTHTLLCVYIWRNGQAGVTRNTQWGGQSSSWALWSPLSHSQWLCPTIFLIKISVAFKSLIGRLRVKTCCNLYGFSPPTSLTLRRLTAQVSHFSASPCSNIQQRNPLR